MALISTEKRVRFSLPLLDIQTADPSELESKAKEALPHIMGALVQNCASSIRQGVVLGYIPTPLFRHKDEAHQPAVITADVYCNFKGLESEQSQQQYIQKLSSQVHALWAHVKKAPHLPCPLAMPDLTPKPSNRHNQVPFDAYRWAQLMMDFARHQGLSNPTAFAALPLFNLNGMDVQLHYSERQAERFEVRLDLGPIPSAHTPGLVYQTLLMHNAIEGHESLCWWALNPANHHVVMVMHQALSISPDAFTPLRSVELAELLNGFTQHASKIWDEVQALSESEIPKPIHSNLTQA